MTNLFLRILQKGRRGVCRSRGFPAAAVHNPTQGTEMALRRTLGSGSHPPCLPCRTGKYSQSDAAGSLNRRIPCGHIVRTGEHAQRNRSGDGKSACRRTHTDISPACTLLLSRRRGNACVYAHLHTARAPSCPGSGASAGQCVYLCRAPISIRRRAHTPAHLFVGYIGRYAVYSRTRTDAHPSARSPVESYRICDPRLLLVPPACMALVPYAPPRHRACVR